LTRRPNAARFNSRSAAVKDLRVQLAMANDNPSNKEIEIVRPMVEERFAKIEEYGKDWDDKSVCQTIVTVSDVSLHGGFSE
jgi:hypothetical protein